MSIQQQINSIDGTVDEQKLKEYMETVPEFVEISLSELETGVYIKYVNNDNKFRSGGLVMDFNIVGDVGLKYMLIRGFNGRIFPLQYTDVKRLWKKPKPKKIIEKQALKPLGEPTNFPVMIDDEIIKYERDSYARERFMKTKKYKRARTVGYYFL